MWTGVETYLHTANELDGTIPIRRKERYLQDLSCLTLFCLIWFVAIVVSSVGIDRGDVDRLLFEHDTDGNLCGVNNFLGANEQGLNSLGRSARDYRGAENSIYTFTVCDPDAPDFDEITYDTARSCRVCVSQCPHSNNTATFEVLTGDTIVFPNAFMSSPAGHSDDVTLSCTFVVISYNKDLNITSKVSKHLQKCYPSYGSKSVHGRCFPDGNLTIPNAVYPDARVFSVSDSLYEWKKTTSGWLTSAWKDLYKSWWSFFVSSTMSLVAFLGWMMFTRFFPGLSVILSFVGALVCTGLLGMFFLWCIAPLESLAELGNPLNPDHSSSDTAFVFAVLVFVFDGLFLVLGIFLLPRWKDCALILDFSWDILNDMWTLCFFPLVMHVHLVVIFIWWFISSCLMTTNGGLEESEHGTAVFHTSAGFQGATVYILIVAVWGMAVAVGLAQMTVGGAVCEYFFTQKREFLPRAMILRSYGRAFSAHLGTIACGVWDMSFLQFLRPCCAYPRPNLKARKEHNRSIQGSSESVFAPTIRAILSMHKRALVQSAIFGQDWTSARMDAVDMLKGKTYRFATTTMYTDGCLFVAKAFIASFGTLCGFGINYFAVEEGLVWNPIHPFLVHCGLTFFLASAYMSIFESLIESVMQSYALDEVEGDLIYSKDLDIDVLLTLPIDDHVVPLAEEQPLMVSRFLNVDEDEEGEDSKDENDSGGGDVEEPLVADVEDDHRDHNATDMTLTAMEKLVHKEAHDLEKEIDEVLKDEDVVKDESAAEEEVARENHVHVVPLPAVPLVDAADVDEGSQSEGEEDIKSSKKEPPRRTPTSESASLLSVNGPNTGGYVPLPSIMRTPSPIMAKHPLDEAGIDEPMPE